MQKYALLISYFGRNYCGWQKQKSASGPFPSVQQTVEDAIQKVAQETVHIVASGRTDSGVHAVGQVVHFVLEKKDWNPIFLERGLNGVLPDDIRIIEAQKVSMDFHAQRSALRKQYSYYFQQGPCPLPHLEPWSWWIRKTLDQGAMAKALNYLVGEHDFKPFRASGAKPGSTVRQILEAEIVRQEITFPQINFLGETPSERPIYLVRVRLVGTGFLKQMVRGITGTLLQIGEGRRSPECMVEILDSLDRNLVGPTAPARGLWLERVWYR